MTTFTYSLVSDMHVNHPQPKTPYGQLEEWVIVAGDTANGLEGLKFLEKLQNKGHKVHAVCGNHEHYSNTNRKRTLEETNSTFTEKFPSIIDIDNSLTMIGVNGWYNITDPRLWHGYMNDGRYSVGPEPEKAAGAIVRQAQFEAMFVEDMLESFFDRKFIVTTHTAPCTETLDPRYEGAFSNEWYWSPFMRQVLARHTDKILVWNHGHTHATNDQVVDGVRVVCNPRGYPGENPEWKPMTIEVEYN